MLPTKYGTGRIIAYGVKYESQEPMVFVIGDPEKVAAPLVRLHSSCFTGDLLESLRCDCGDQLHMALDMIQQRRLRRAGLPAAGRPRHRTGRKDQSLRPAGPGPRHGRSQHRARLQGRPARLRRRHPAAEGPRPAAVRLLTNNPKKTDAFIYGGFDLEVVDQIPIVGPIHEHNADYMATKRDKMGHKLPHD